MEPYESVVNYRRTALDAVRGKQNGANLQHLMDIDFSLIRMDAIL